MDINQKTNKFWIDSKKNLIETMFLMEGIKDAKILEIGCADCDNYLILKKFGDITFVDSDSKFMKFLPKGCKGKVASVYDLPFQKESFDVVLIFGLLEHLKDDRLALKEINRVLIKGGKLIYFVPAFSFLFSSHDKAIGHYRRYSKKELTDLININFKVKNMYFWNFLAFFPVFIFRLFRKRSKPKVDFITLPLFVDRMIYYEFKTETKLIKKNFKLPVGVGIIGVAEKIN
ncbi:MAG: class I SAM-dependent methyltransferase [archaeon]